MKSLVLLTNCDKVRTICQISLKDININLSVVKSVDHIAPSDMVLLDESFINGDLSLLKAYVSKLKPQCNKIGLLTSRRDFDKDFVSFVIYKPFLPNHLIQVIISQFNAMDSFKVQLTDTNFEKNIDKSIITHKNTGKQTQVLDKNEIQNIKNLLKDTSTQRKKQNNIHLNIDKVKGYDDSNIKQIDRRNINKTINNTITLDRFLLEQLMPLFAVVDKDVVSNLMRGKVVNLKLKLSS